MKRRYFAAALLGSMALACSSGSGEPGDGQAPASTASVDQALGATAAVPGFADLHLHLMAEEAFGGRWLYGRHQGPLDDCDGGASRGHGAFKEDVSALTQRIQACGGLPGAIDDVAMPAVDLLARGVGGLALSEAIGSVPGSQGDTGLHLGRARIPEDLPAWDSIAHQQAHVSWLRSAHDRGLSLVVLSAVSFDFFCELLPQGQGQPACDEMADVDRQLALARQLDAANDWLEIALSPAHARRIIGEGKLAVVLSIEASHLFGRDTGKDFVAELDRYFAMGVRTLQPVHETDNRFGGAAAHQPLLQLAEFTENCRIDHDCGLTTDEYTLGLDVERVGGRCQNALGLTSDGRRLLQAMIDRRMLIDVAHLSAKGVDDAYAVAAANQYYPLYVSHGHLREVMGEDVADTEKSTPASVIAQIRRTGGMFGLRTAHNETRQYAQSVQNSCQGSSRSFAQAYDYAVKGLKVPVAFGSDLNGFVQQTRPRFGEDGCSATEWSLLVSDGKFTPFEAQADCERRDQRERGAAPLGNDFDTKGLAHVGLLPDLVADLSNLGVDTGPLLRSAEAFIVMWERASAARSGPASSGSDIDTSGIGPLSSRESRPDAYPSRCGKHYCPSHAELDAECRFNDECKSQACSSPDVSCGIPSGLCVCNDDADCGAQRFCDEGTPGIGADNHCEARRGDHAACGRDGQCASGECGGCLNAVGWCFTPNARRYGQACVADGECTTGRCSADCYANPTGTCLCNADSDCGSGQYCGWGTNSGSCRAKKSKGSLCTSARECASDRCSWGFCK
jgi:microsomal dipeptidase-like Zn-dependent dipeptidase